MDKDAVRSSVREKVMSFEGVDCLEFLDQNFRQALEERERTAEGNGAVGGLMAFVNTGVWEVLTRQEVFVIVVRPQAMLLSPQEHLVHIVDQKGTIIGEYLPEDRREDVELRENAYLLSDDFVIYGDVDIVGEPYFLIPPMSFPPLEGMPGVNNPVSASVSTVSDEYIRTRLGFKHTKHWTHLVGYNL